MVAVSGNRKGEQALLNKGQGHHHHHSDHPHKKKRSRPVSSTLPPPLSSTSDVTGPHIAKAVLDLLAKNHRSRHRSLLVLLSSSPQTALCELYRGWKKAGGRGKVVVVGEAVEAHKKVFEGVVKEQLLRAVTSLEEMEALEGKCGLCVIPDLLHVPLEGLGGATLTVQGGGLLVLVLPSVSHWEELRRRQGWSSALDRLLVSFPLCKSLVAMDHKLEVLPWSTYTSKGGREVHESTSFEGDGDDMDLDQLKESLGDTLPVGPLVGIAASVDQARMILTFLESAADKSLTSTLTVTGLKGRGKSAAIGLCMAGAVAYGYSNIFVTAPTLKSSQRIFEYLLKGFDALGYQEGKDYDLIQAKSDPYIIRVNIFREHRQTVQYLFPDDHMKLDQAELLAIDDAAALELEVFSNLLGPYLMVVCSTVGGLNGAGPYAAKRVMEEVKKQQVSSATQLAAAAAAEVKGSGSKKGVRQVHEERWRKAAEAVSSMGSGARQLQEVTLDEPIHYSPHDPLERWALRVLGLPRDLDRLRFGLPAPWDCELYYVEPEALLSGHGLTDQFLHRLLALLGAWDRGLGPSAMQRLIHTARSHVVVLMGPQAEDQGDSGEVPDVLALIQFKVDDDASSVRVMHLGSHPDALRMGYGTRALELLRQYLSGDLVGMQPSAPAHPSSQPEGKTLTTTKSPPKAREGIPPLLLALEDKGYIISQSVPITSVVIEVGVTNLDLLGFFTRAGYAAVDLEGDRVTMVRGLGEEGEADRPYSSSHSSPIQERVQDFRRRFLRLLPCEYSTMNTEIVLMLLGKVSNIAAPGQGVEGDEEEPTPKQGPSHENGILTADEEAFLLSPHDLKRLDMYAKSLVEEEMVADLLPLLVELLCLGRLSGVAMPDLQRAILVALGLQRKGVTKASAEFYLPSHQVSALFSKAIRKVNAALQALQEEEVEREMAAQKKTSALQLAQAVRTAREGFTSLPNTMDDELEAKAKESMARLRQQQQDLLGSSDLMRYAVKGSAEEWEEILKDSKKAKSGSVQIKTKREVPKEGATESLLDSLLGGEDGDRRKKKSKSQRDEEYSKKGAGGKKKRGPFPGGRAR